MNYTKKAARVSLACLAVASPAFAENNIDVGVVLDGQYKSHDTALSGIEQGFSLGHSELSLAAPIDDMFSGRMTAVLENHEGATEVELEEAFLQTTAMPANVSVTAGRFLSHVGYLNSRHTHEDNFAERPAIYQAMLGGHYFDDGARVNLLLPTPFYWRVGVEAFDGARLAGIEHEEDVGVYTVNSKWGGDIGTTQGWQVGLSFLKNRLVDLAAGHEEEGEGDHEESEGHDEHEGHEHSAQYSAENVYIADAVWKWAPNGNAKERQWVVSMEYLRGEDINEYATSDDVHEGWYVSVAHRFAPQWSAGARYGEATLQLPHDDHFHEQKLEEAQLSLAWSRSHFSTVRLTYSDQQSDTIDEARDALTLQYTMMMGAHAAHEF